SPSHARHHGNLLLPITASYPSPSDVTAAPSKPRHQSLIGRAQGRQIRAERAPTLPPAHPYSGLPSDDMHGLSGDTVDDTTTTTSSSARCSSRPPPTVSG
ncbi:Os02g0438601, partial [Oryza sativa Japonica Group]